MSVHDPVRAGLAVLDIRVAHLKMAFVRGRVNQIERDDHRELCDEIGAFLARFDFSDQQMGKLETLVEDLRILNDQHRTFFEKNGKVYDRPTMDELKAKGRHARLAYFLDIFPVNGCESENFVSRELPVILEALKIQTIGELSAKTQEEIRGPQSNRCSPEMFAWIDYVCREFGLSRPRGSITQAVSRA